MVLDFMVMNFANSLKNNRAKGHTKVCTDQVHKADNRQVLSIVYNYVRVFKYEKRLQENEEKTQYLRDQRECKRDAAFVNRLVIIRVDLEQLYETKATVNHRTNAKYSDAAAHV